jgi:hypothetical protein
MRRRSVLATAGIVVALSTASLLTGLRHALSRRGGTKPELTPREAERRRVREALKDMLAPPIDFNNWPEHLRPHDDAAERRERLRRALAPMTVKLDSKRWKAKFGRLPDDFDLAAFRASLPVLDPPLSQTIIEERESYDF